MARFEILKLLHVSCVVLSLTLFQIRAWRAVSGHAPSGFRDKILPHLVDTLLLLSAIGLLLVIRLNPLSAPWLVAKFLALPVYVILGYQAMKSIGNRRRQIFLVLAATICVAYIVGVAMTRNPAIVG